jgi:hypothetical protein
MAYELQALGELAYKVFIKYASDIDTREGAITHHNAIQTSRLTLLDEVGPVGGFWCDEISK